MCGINHAKNACTVTDWYCQFCASRKFKLAPQNKDLPPLLNAHPYLCLRTLTKHARENLNTLSIEMLAEYIYEKVLPRLVREDNDERIVLNTTTIPEYDIKLKAHQSGVTCVSPSTVASLSMNDPTWLLQWAKKEGSYYVDNNKKPATVQHHWSFCKHYLNYKQRVHWRVQVPEREGKDKLEQKGDVAADSGYKYTRDDRLAMVENHCDSIKTLKKEWISTSIEGSLSVHFPKNHKPLIIRSQWVYLQTVYDGW